MTLETKPFGTTHGGEAVTLYRLTHPAGLTAEVLDYGCTLRSLAPAGRADVCLGYDTLAEYEDQDACLGAVVGRYANRIGGGRFSLNGRDYPLAVNNGPNHLHGGLRGFDRYVWAAQAREDGVVFSRRSPDGEEGYPGSLDVAVTYRLTADALEITYEARTDADTVLNLTNHAYFNLSGGGDVLGHSLQINASHFTEIDQSCLTTGRILPVAGTPMDFRVPKPVGRDLGADCEQLRNGNGYDHNFILDAPGLDHAAARLTAPDGGLTLEVRTDLPGVQLYTANFLTQRQGKGGAVYGPRCSLCLETQFFPDSPNHPEFPSPILRKGERFYRTTIFQIKDVLG